MIRIVLTATINPQSTFRLNLVDPQERFNQYASSLSKWCDWAGKTDDVRLVLIENSGADLERLAVESVGLVPSFLELVSAPAPPAEVVSHGKGASECMMLDFFADKYSEDPGDTIWLKATGRLFVANLSDIIPNSTSKASMFGRLSLDLKHADARLFGSSAYNWKKFLWGMGSDIDEGQDQRLEHVLARRVCLGLGSGAILDRFQGQPQIEGISGTWAGRNYGSLRNSLKRQVAQIIDFVLREKLRNKHF